MANLIIGLMLFVMSGLLAGAGQIQPTRAPASEVTLPLYQKAALEADLPATDVLFDHGNNLWVVGKTSLWRWLPKINRLQKLELVKSNAEPESLQSAKLVGRNLFVASNRSIYKISFKPKQVLRFAHPVGSGATVGIQSIGGTTWWLHSKGIAELDSKGKIRLAKNTPALFKGDRAFVTGNQKNLWLARGKKLLIFKLGKKNSTTLVHTAKNHFYGMGLYKDEAIIHTPLTVLKFDRHLRLTQAIPVQGTHKLLSMDIGERFHSYLFSDNIMEIYDTNHKRKIETTLAIKPQTSVKKAIYRQNQVAIIANGKPQIFLIGERLNVAQDKKLKTKKL